MKKDGKEQMTDNGEYMTTYIEDWLEDIEYLIEECENELLLKM